MSRTIESFLIFVALLALAQRATAAPPTDSAKGPAGKSTDGKKPADGDDPTLSNSAHPVQVGEFDPADWQPFSEAQQAESVKQLKAFALKSATQMKHPLRLQETREFLLYSDLMETDAARYASLLERMYGKLAEMFGIGKTQALFRGKFIVFGFTRIEDYRVFESVIEHTDPGSSYGMTHCFGDGIVHMAFYRYPNEAQFTHLLVHESVHGFIDRYRSPAMIPSWANEGLADTLASELIPNAARLRLISELARAGLEQHGNSLGNFFNTPHIEGWQYPIAETLCAWMIRANRRAYLDFINGIKDGQTWEQSLKDHYKMAPDRLLADYAKSLGAKPIRFDRPPNAPKTEKSS